MKKDTIKTRKPEERSKQSKETERTSRTVFKIENRLKKNIMVYRKIYRKKRTNKQSK